MNERWLQMTSSPLTKFSATTRVQSAMARLKTFMAMPKLRRFVNRVRRLGLHAFFRAQLSPLMGAILP
jgi:hypothetical protein